MERVKKIREEGEIKERLRDHRDGRYVEDRERIMKMRQRDGEQRNLEPPRRGTEVDKQRLMMVMIMTS